jgi:hypothetical protein
MINDHSPARSQPGHATAIPGAAERGAPHARSQRDLVIASLLRCPDREQPS